MKISGAPDGIERALREAVKSHGSTGETAT